MCPTACGGKAGTRHHATPEALKKKSARSLCCGHIRGANKALMATNKRDVQEPNLMFKPNFNLKFVLKLILF